MFPSRRILAVTGTDLPAVLILATYRDSELRHAEALRDTLGALRAQRDLRPELGGLDDHEVASFLEAAPRVSTSIPKAWTWPTP